MEPTIQSVTPDQDSPSDALERANSVDPRLADLVCHDLSERGFSVQPSCLDLNLISALQEQVFALPHEEFNAAGVGRQKNFMRNDFIRSDEVCWIVGDTQAGAAWLQWTESLRLAINQRLFMGLFSFESHYARYRPGARYKRHLDAFRGSSNRVLSIVAYLNNDWLQQDGGELVLYRDQKDRVGLKVTPLAGTVVLFLSEIFPHEVLPASRDRYSVAGWYRINASSAAQLDPPS